MITIVTTTEDQYPIAQMIARVDRLHELVHLSTDGVIEMGNKVLQVSEGYITSPIDWFDTEPPYHYPETPLTENNLLALVFDKLGNQQRAFQFLHEDDLLYPHLLASANLRFGYEFTEDLIGAVPTDFHNQAIINHYGLVEPKKSFKELRESYAKALEDASDLEAKCFTAKHYLNLLMDGGLFEEAVEAVKGFLRQAPSRDAKLALSVQWCSASFKNLNVPYSKEVLQDLSRLQSQCIADLEERGLQLNVALLAMEACDVANFLGDFSQAKTYINKAIQHFKEEGITEFLGEAGLKKAHLLYHWSKNGSPQYYKAAINAFQDTLKVFKRDVYPEHFAEVQHNLALIYSEIPVADEERPIWTAFSASAFKEAMAIHTKQAHPYEYGMLCHNYATALMDFPPAKLHDNFKRADGLFEEALQIRTARDYPTERALTLLNQLELGWLMHNANVAEETKRYIQMKSKAEEIKTLVTDENLISKTTAHLEKLIRLKTII